MKDISELGKSFDAFLNSMKKKLVEAQDHATDDMLDETLARVEIPLEARNIGQFLAYQDSIKKKKAELKNNQIESSVYSDLLVGGDSKWAEVPVGAFLEWGTGRFGESSNEYPHGYDYTTEKPWDLHTEMQYRETGSWGITARPHMYPALKATEYLFEQNIKEAIEEAWTE